MVLLATMETLAPAEQPTELLEPQETIAIVRTTEDLATYYQAALFAGGTTIEILPHTESTVDTFLSDRDQKGRPEVDYETLVRTAMDAGAIIMRVTEDLEYRHQTPGSVWTHYLKLVKSKSEN